MTKPNAKTSPKPEPLTLQKADTPEADPDLGADGNLSRLKQILFGSELKEQKEAVESAAGKLTEQLTTLEARLRAEVKRIESEFQGRIDAMGRRLDTEQDARQASIEELDQRQGASARAQDRKLMAQDRRQSELLEELRLQQDTRVVALEDEIQQRFSKVLELLDEEVRSVRHSKTDRRALAELLTEVASGLLVPDAR